MSPSTVRSASLLDGVSLEMVGKPGVEEMPAGGAGGGLLLLLLLRLPCLVNCFPREEEEYDFRREDDDDDDLLRSGDSVSESAISMMLSMMRLAPFMMLDQRPGRRSLPSLPN